MGGWYSGRLVGYGEKERVLRGSEWRMGREEEEEKGEEDASWKLGEICEMHRETMANQHQHCTTEL